MAKSIFDPLATKCLAVKLVQHATTSSAILIDRWIDR